VIARDHGRCHVCGEQGADQADHVVPVSAGGIDHDSNMAAIHRTPCHTTKTARESKQARAKQH
jgi:5-methylcytosine-specific restriction protein A